MVRIARWLAERLDLRAFALLVAEGLREFGLLWAVFSVLDRLLTTGLSGTWLVVNLLFSFVVWLTGAILAVVKVR